MLKEIPLPTVIVITSESSDGVGEPVAIPISALIRPVRSNAGPARGVVLNPCLSQAELERLQMLDEEAD